MQKLKEKMHKIVSKRLEFAKHNALYLIHNLLCCGDFKGDSVSAGDFIHYFV